MPPACRVPKLSASFCAGNDGVEDFSFRLLVTLIRPDAPPDQMILQADNRIAQWPGIGFGLRPVGGWIIGRGVRADAIGDIFDQRRPEIAPRALDRPLRDGIDGEVVVAVDTQRRNAEAKPARREGA